jgi:hypothetical protein
MFLFYYSEMVWTKGTTILLEVGGYGIFLKKYSDSQCWWREKKKI